MKFDHDLVAELAQFNSTGHQAAIQYRAPYAAGAMSMAQRSMEATSN